MKFLFTDNRIHTFYIVIMLIIIGSFYNIVGEHIAGGDGLGFDGLQYGSWAMHFNEIFEGKTKVLSFRARRILPSLIAHIFFKATNIVAGPSDVVMFFQWYNLFLLAMAAIAWGNLADSFELDKKKKWLGAFGLFCNHAVLKYNLFYPVLTDTTAFCISIFMLWAFFLKRPFFLTFFMLLGVFSWPTIPFLGIALLIFPRRDSQPEPFNSLSYLSFFGLVMLFSFTLLTFYLSESNELLLSPYTILSFGIVYCFLAVSYFVLLNNKNFFQPKYFFSSINYRGIILSGGVLCFSAAIFSLISSNDEHAVVMSMDLNRSTIKMAIDYFFSIFIHRSKRPAEFIIAHILYFGPLLIVSFCFYKKVFLQCQRFGYGFLFVSMITIFQLLMPLSREILAEYPVVVIATILACKDMDLTDNFMVFFASFSLLLSKVWMLFNLIPDPSPEKGWIKGFSFENYVSSTGWWMSDSMYLIQGAVVAFAFVFLVFYFHLIKPLADQLDKKIN